MALQYLSEGSRLGVDIFFFGSEREGISVNSKMRVKLRTREELKMRSIMSGLRMGERE